MDHQDDVDAVVAGLLRPLVDQELSIVFYDMTTIGAAGLSEQEGDLRQYGMSKEGLVKRQVMLGVVQTAEGLPIYHELVAGNTAEVKTLKPTLAKVLKRFPIKRIIVVADRGLLSTDNLEELQAMRLPCGAPLEFILAVPGRRYRDFKDILQPLHKTYCQDAETEVVGEATWQGLRLVMAHDPHTAAEKSAKREQTIADLEAQAEQWAGNPSSTLYESKLLISLLTGFKNAPTSALFVVLVVLQPQTNPSVPGSSWRVQIPTASDAASPCGVESDA